MKAIKRLLPILVAVAFSMVAFAGVAFAAPGDQLSEPETTIEATNLTAGDSVVYFQLVEWSSSARDWVLTEVGESCGVTLAELKNGISAEEAATIASNVTGSGTSMAVTGTTATATVDAGLYYLLATPADTNKDTVYNPAFVSADYKEGGNTVSFNTTYADSAVLKKSDNTFDKSVDDENQTKYNDVKPGDIIPYKITTKIPSYSGAFTDPTFTITDDFSAGLTLHGDITVTYGNKSTKVTNDDVTITPNTDDGGGFVIEFKDAYLLSDRGVVDVEVTYSAEVTTNAPMSVNAMDNTATLEFSNKPDETETKQDITRHYTFSIDGGLLGGGDEVTKELIKTGTDASGNPISEEVEYYNEKEGAPLSGATFTLTPVAPTTGQAQTKQSTADGRINFSGLDAGTYTLVETAAPAGFIKDSRTFTVTITPTYDTQTPDLLVSYEITITAPESGDTPAYSGGATFEMSNTGETIVKTTASGEGSDTSFINNTQGSELPSTGGMGTTILYIIGGALVLIAGASLIARRVARKQSYVSRVS